MREAAQSPYIVRFDSFEVNLRSGELRQNGEKLKLPEQSFQILGILLERAGEVVMRKEVQKRLWPNDTVVEFENSINAAIKRLRSALGDQADHPRYVETLARRGYRWIGPVEWLEASIPVPQFPRPSFVDSPIPGTGSNLTGKKVSHYRILEILGGGGMGVVYKAEDIKLGRRVALKFLPEELSSDAAAMERFEREARAASALNHPNICTIHAVEEHAGQPFIVMELLEGQTLGQMIAAEHAHKRVLPLEQIIEIATQVTEGLGAAHNKGIIHRDIKPANIFITHRGQAKLLDFGLAKLLVSENMDIPQVIASGENSGVRNLNLSKTGIAMGTAGYMSPEQVRGDKLDARTDLFSFGLILYEMATGERAFTGETAPIIYDAILNDKPRSIRELSPKLSRKLEDIIDQALQKDCDLRYQTAAQIQDDLHRLKSELTPTNISFRRKLMVAAIAAVLLIFAAIFWLGKPKPSQEARQPNQRQLTSNSFENAVQGGAISPDGRYIAYRDKKQMYVKDIASGETKIIPKPAALKDAKVQWDINPWFRDGSSFLATANVGPSQRRSIWTVASSGGAPRKLHDDAAAWSVSPDGSLIAFTTSNGRTDNRIWLMNAKGEQAHIVYEADGTSNLARVEFSPGGERLLFLRENVLTDDEPSLESVRIDLKGSSPISVISASEQKNSGPSECLRGCRLHDFLWLPDGRLIYVLREPGPVGDTCYLWVKRLDPHTAETIEKSHPLTKAGNCIESLTVTADGTQLALLKWTPHLTSYLADLSPDGRRIANPRHFPLTESSDGAAGWTPDSKALILVSNRSGHFGIYKQALNEDAAQPLVTDSYGRDPHVTPDGKWILYFGITESQKLLIDPAPLMRVPIIGGRADFVFTAKPWALITCARAPSNLCVIDEPTDDREQAIVSVLDPLSRRGPELFRYKLDSKDISSFSAISPEGKRIAYIPSNVGPIFVRSLAGDPTMEIPVNGWSNLQNLTWSADGKALYLSADTSGGKALLHIDLHAKVNVVWENLGASAETIAVPSPDGRHLAMQSWTSTSNMWILEDF